MADDARDDDDSTLVHTGKLAMSLTEMQAFVKGIEDRPTARLIHDLEGLMALPESKHQLVVMVLGKRMQSDEVERLAVLKRLRRLQESSADPTVRDRARTFLQKPAS